MPRRALKPPPPRGGKSGKPRASHICLPDPFVDGKRAWKKAGGDPEPGDVVRALTEPLMVVEVVAVDLHLRRALVKHRRHGVMYFGLGELRPLGRFAEFIARRREGQETADVRRRQEPEARSVGAVAHAGTRRRSLRDETPLVPETGESRRPPGL